MEENKVNEVQENEPKVEQKVQTRKLPFGKEVEIYQQYEFADAYLWCGKCGSDVRAGGTLENVQTALHIDAIGTDSHSLMAMACPICGNVMALHFKEALNPPAPEVKPVVKEEDDKDVPLVETEEVPA